MANGFFLGGAAEGMEAANKQALAERTLANETGLRTRALDLQERQVRSVESQNAVERLDKGIADTMSVVSETIKSGIAGGSDPNKVLAAVAPLVESAKQLAAKAGRDPASLDAQVQALAMQPNAIVAAEHAGTAKGTASAAAAIAEARAIAKAGAADIVGGIKDPKDRAAAENSLRDDFTKQAQPFITIRDAKNRLDNIEKTGAGDIALLFQYMKILDPGSTVREGEFATAGSVAGVPGQIEALRKSVVGGGRLADSARNQILSQANKLYQAAASQHDKLQTSFAGIAKRQKLNVDNVVVDLTPSSNGKPDPLGIR